MGGVADDRVGQVLQMAPDLVAAAGHGAGLDQTGSHGVEVRIDRARHGQSGQRDEGSPGRLRWGVGWRIVGAQGMVDGARPGQPTPCHGQVGLVHSALGKSLTQASGGFTVQGHQQHAAGAAVQPVHRPDRLAELVAQGLQHEARGVRIQARAVHQPAGGFVDRHQMRVAPKNGQGLVHDRPPA
jgi:hypothetical protein